LGNSIIYESSGKIGINEISPSYDLEIGGTSAVKLSTGTTAQRPTGELGIVRVNSSTNKIEFHDGTSWYDFLTSADGNFYWQPNGNEIYYTADNVGIGVSNPGYQLDVWGDNDISNPSASFRNGSDQGTTFSKVARFASSNTGYNAPALDIEIAQWEVAGTDARTEALFAVRHEGAATFTDILKLRSDGNIYLPTYDNLGAERGAVNYTLGVATDGRLIAMDSIPFWSRNGNEIYYTADNVGIGVSNPDRLLDVVGDDATDPPFEVENGSNQGTVFSKIARFKTANSGHWPSALDIEIAQWEDNLSHGRSEVLFSVRHEDNPDFVDMLRLRSDGRIYFDQYGSGSITGTAAKWLAVTSAGIIIEEDPPTPENTAYSSSWDDDLSSTTKNTIYDELVSLRD